ncbi:DMT family transporter [Oceaniglobus ichthyenteri]|uniref:DMT family transporter n=1 Tax=Oceaniglobus ichthyenteri TaxID=2136177 RepID=UPI000D37C722|nr:DMT family transporter [Oceaniglobus ichthyenteri]
MWARLGPAERGHLAMLLFSALVAGSFSLGALAANEISPLALTAVRFVLASAVVGGIAAATTGISRSAFRAPWRFVVLGSMFAIYFVLMFEGLKTAPPVSASAVFTLTPVLAAGFGWLLLRQITDGWTAAALLIGAVGALWVIFRGDVSAILHLEIGRGEAIYFIGCVAHAAYIPMVRKLNRGEPAFVFVFGMLVAATLVLLVIAAPQLWQTDWRNLAPIVWITIVYTAVFASAATFVLLQYAALRLPASNVMAYTYLTPGWVILWEVFLHGTMPQLQIIGGFALTALAIIMLLKKKGTRAR